MDFVRVDILMLTFMKLVSETLDQAQLT